MILKKAHYLGGLIAVSIIIAMYLLFPGIHKSFAQEKEATFDFQEKEVQIPSGQTGTITIQIRNSDGISAFNLAMAAENATIESVDDTFSVNSHRTDAIPGEKAQGSDYSTAINHISSDKKTAKVSAITSTSVETANLATDLTFTASVKRTGEVDGQIRFLTDQGEQLVGEGQTNYTITMGSPVVLTSGGGGGNQDGQGNLIFSPTEIATDNSTVHNLDLMIQESTGIVAFTLVVNAQDATIEEIVGVTDVSGGSAQANNYRKAAHSIRNNNQTARMTYTVSGISNNTDLATEVTMRIKVKKSSNADGTITFDVGDTKLAGPDGAEYDPVAANQATLTSTSGGGDTPTQRPTQPETGNCSSYWAIGDANCTGPKPDEKDFNLWEDGFIPQDGPADKSACIQVGNISQDFNSDGKTDLIDFEIWRRGKYGSQSNQVRQWPSECM